jgi:hypothetical protein
MACHDFAERKLVPTHYTLRAYGGSGGHHVKSWLVETSADGETWRQVAREANNNWLLARFWLQMAQSGASSGRWTFAGITW